MKPPPLTPPSVDDIDWTGTGEASPEWTAAVAASAPRAPTLADVETVFQKWIGDSDREPTRALLATYVANVRLEGDPVWLMLVGGSGAGKTERLQSLSGLPDVVTESSISGPAALLSGTGKKERAKD